MEMEGCGTAPDINDWEFLHVSSESDPSPESPYSHGHGHSDEGVIRSNYFSLDSSHKYHEHVASGAPVNVASGSTEDDVSTESDNPSWIDPSVSETQYPAISAEFWSDSTSNPSSDSISRKSVDVDSLQLGFGDNIVVADSKASDGFYEVDEVDNRQGQNSSSDCSHSGISLASDLESGFTGPLVDHNTDNCELKLHESEQAGADLTNMRSDAALSPVPSLQEDEEKIITKGAEFEEKGQVMEKAGDPEGGRGIKPTNGKRQDKNRAVWWKVPSEFMRYCVFRVSPVWSFSIAAAVVGLVLLGKKLYKMNHKTQGIRFQVTIDGKKVSQFMNRASRLNEAFSVVKRVPVVRAPLPAPEVAHWPMMSFR